MATEQDCRLLRGPALGARTDAAAHRLARQSRTDHRNADQSTLPLTAKLPGLGNNWGPRVSLAIGEARDHWPVLRLGYGMYYGRTENATIETALTQTGSLKGDLNFFMRPTDDCQHCPAARRRFLTSSPDSQQASSSPAPSSSRPTSAIPKSTRPSPPSNSRCPAASS